VAAIDPAEAIAAQQQAVAVSAKPRRVLSIGNAGALGEQIISNLLAANVELKVVSEKNVRSTARRLDFVDSDLLGDSARWPPVDEVVIVVGGKHSYFKRDDAFPVLTEEDAAQLARNASQAGVIRALVVAPMEAWLSATLSHAHRFGKLEASLRELPFEKLVVVRPGVQRESLAGGSWLQRIANTMLSTLGGYLMPQSLQPLRSQMVAQAALELFVELPAGQHFLGAEDIYRCKVRADTSRARTVRPLYSASDLNHRL
jgi:hypothetical protein